MKIGVTGATGQLGRYVIESLKEKSSANQIVALVRSPEKAVDLGVEVRSFNYGHPENLVDALNGIDKLLLISGNEIGKRTEHHTNVIEAAKKAGIKFVAYTSLLHADSSTLVLSGEHLQTEKVLKNSGIPFAILRNGWYTENYTDSIKSAVFYGVLLGSSGNGKISSATRADFSLAAATVLSTTGHDGKTYELAGDNAYTLSEMASEIARQTGKAIFYKNLSVEEYAASLIQAGLPESIAHFLAGTHVAAENGDLFDNSRQLSQLTGKPTTSLAQAIAEALTGLQ